MKKLSLALVIASVLFCSCTTKFQTTSHARYMKQLDEVSEQISNKGYSLTGHSSDTKNELVATASTYNTRTGYSNKIENDNYHYDKYAYKKADGSSLDYTVKYKLFTDNTDEQFVTAVSVIDCNCDNAEDYSSLCEKEILTINDVLKDATAKLTDVMMTTITITAAILVATGIICALVY